MQDMFKQLHQRHHLDDDSDMDESHQLESMDNNQYPRKLKQFNALLLQLLENDPLLD
jgi:hypothetical protein